MSFQNNAYLISDQFCQGKKEPYSQNIKQNDHNALGDYTWKCSLQTNQTNFFLIDKPTPNFTTDRNSAFQVSVWETSKYSQEKEFTEYLAKN